MKERSSEDDDDDGGVLIRLWNRHLTWFLRAAQGWSNTQTGMELCRELDKYFKNTKTCDDTVGER